MKTIATIFAMIVTMTFVGCGNTAAEEKVENADSVKTEAVDTNLVAADTTTVAVDSVKK